MFCLMVKIIDDLIEESHNNSDKINIILLDSEF